MQTCIYKISNSINSRIYIGSAKDFRNRKNRHLSQLKKNAHCNKKLQKFVNKYGVDKLVFSIVENCTINDLLTREQYHIDNTQCVKSGFNILPVAGSWLNNKHGLKAKKAISKSKTGKQYSLGRRLSEETKDKIRQKAIGRKQSFETIQKRVSKNTGKIRSAEANLKVAIKKSKLTDEQVREIRLLLNSGSSQEKIAKMYSVCQRNVCRIKNRISYNHVS